MHRRDMNDRLIWCLVPTYRANQRLQILRRWTKLVSPERWYPCTKLHGFTSQKTEMTTNITICDLVSIAFEIKHALLKLQKVKLSLFR
jgi:hypothetical protein